MYNLEKYPSVIKKQDLLKLLNYYHIPPYPLNSDEVIKNTAIDFIPSSIKIKYGITTNKSIIKSFPTNKIFCKNKTDIFNRLNQTALPINSSIIILHQSLDQKWFFILSEAYSGWIEKKYILICNYDNFKQNLHKKDYITIIEPFITYQDYIIDMGCQFNYRIKNNLTYLLLITKKGLLEIPVTNGQYVFQSMPLKKENVHNLAYKYLDVPYDLGDNLYKVDCSSFIGNILKTCNIIIPRDTKDIIKFLNISNALIPNSSKIQLLHFKGHIALYLYSKKNKDYYIHANAKNMKVTIDFLGEHYLNYQDIIGVSRITDCQKGK